jgi:hypothetical protein
MAIASGNETTVTLLVSGAGENPETRLVQLDLPKSRSNQLNSQGKAIAKLSKDERVTQVALLG